MDGIKLPLGIRTGRPHPKHMSGTSRVMPSMQLANASGFPIANHPSDVDAGIMGRQQIHFTDLDFDSSSEPDSENPETDPLKDPETTTTTYSSRTSFGDQSRDSKSSYTARFSSVTSLFRGTASNTSSDRWQISDDTPQDSPRESWESAEQEVSISQQQQCNDSPRVSCSGSKEEITKSKQKLVMVGGVGSLLRNRTRSGRLPDNARVEHPAQVAQCAQELQQLEEQKNMEQESIAKLVEAKTKLEQDMQKIQKELKEANQKFEALCIKVTSKEQDILLLGIQNWNAHGKAHVRLPKLTHVQQQCEHSFEQKLQE